MPQAKAAAVAEPEPTVTARVIKRGECGWDLYELDIPVSFLDEARKVRIDDSFAMCLGIQHSQTVKEHGL